MKRSSALAPLSRDHQHALDVALRLRRLAPDALERFKHFFETEGRRHFDIEEELLLPALPQGDAEWGPGVKRVLEDHAAIRGAAATDTLLPDALRELGDRLNDHVRFEERVLFEILERRLPAAELERLGAAITVAERRPSS